MAKNAGQIATAKKMVGKVLGRTNSYLDAISLDREHITQHLDNEGFKTTEINGHSQKAGYIYNAAKNYYNSGVVTLAPSYTEPEADPPKYSAHITGDICKTDENMKVVGAILNSLGFNVDYDFPTKNPELYEQIINVISSNPAYLLTRTNTMNPLGILDNPTFTTDIPQDMVEQISDIMLNSRMYSGVQPGTLYDLNDMVALKSTEYISRLSTAIERLRPQFASGDLFDLAKNKVLTKWNELNHVDATVTPFCFTKVSKGGKFSGEFPYPQPVTGEWYGIQLYTLAFRVPACSGGTARYVSFGTDYVNNWSSDFGIANVNSFTPTSANQYLFGSIKFYDENKNQITPHNEPYKGFEVSWIAADAQPNAQWSGISDWGTAFNKKLVYADGMEKVSNANDIKHWFWGNPIYLTNGYPQGNWAVWNNYYLISNLDFAHPVTEEDEEEEEEEEEEEGEPGITFQEGALAPSPNIAFTTRYASWIATRYPAINYETLVNYPYLPLLISPAKYSGVYDTDQSVVQLGDIGDDDATWTSISNDLVYGTTAYRGGAVDDPDEINTDSSGITEENAAAANLVDNFINTYQLTTAEQLAFTGWLWNITDWIDRVFTKPSDAIASFHYMYVSPTVVTTAAHIQMNGKTSATATGNAVKPKMIVDCGTITIPEYYNNYRDYAPYTNIVLYLPFVGGVNLDTNMVMGRTIEVKYGVDLVTGDFLAMVKLITGDSLNALIHVASGNCAYNIPLRVRNDAALASAVVSTATAIVGTVSSGEVSGIQTAGGDMSALNKPIKLGNVGGNALDFASLVPFVTITRPIPADPDSFSTFYGYPAKRTVRLGDCSGFTQVKDVHLDGFSATKEEKDMIVEKLKNGVLI